MYFYREELYHYNRNNSERQTQKFVTIQVLFLRRLRRRGKGMEARAPRAPARGLRPPAPPAEWLQKYSLFIAVPGEVDDDESETTQGRGERFSSIEKRACRIQRRYGLSYSTR